MNIKTIQSIMTDAMNHFNAEALCYALLVTIYWKRRVPGALLGNDVSYRLYGDTQIFCAVISDKNHIFGFGLMRCFCCGDIFLSQIRICRNLKTQLSENPCSRHASPAEYTLLRPHRPAVY